MALILSFSQLPLKTSDGRKKKGQEIQFLAFIINFIWGQSCRVWGLQRAPHPKRNSAQVLLTLPIILQLRPFIFNFHIKLCCWKRLLSLPHRPTMKNPSTKTDENSLNRLKFLPKFIWTEIPMNIISNTPLFCLDTSFCLLYIYVWACSSNHSLTAKKWWINYKLWEEEDSIPHLIFFSFKRNFKCSHRFTNIPAGLYSACLSGRTSLKTETVFSYYTKPPVWSWWII